MPEPSEDIYLQHEASDEF